jgi:RimJ/RimL family protein N-acetyltransferase
MQHVHLDLSTSLPQCLPVLADGTAGSRVMGCRAMIDALETERLWLAPWSVDDLELLVFLGADPRVTRFVGDGATWSRARAAEVAATVLAHWRGHGFGWRIAVSKADEKPIGFIALNLAGEGKAGVAPEEYEIGWWLDPRAWGRGLAEEAARAVREEAFERLAAPQLVARIQPANGASRRLAERIGMRHELDTAGRWSEPACIYRTPLS